MITREQDNKIYIHGGGPIEIGMGTQSDDLDLAIIQSWHSGLQIKRLLTDNSFWH